MDHPQDFQAAVGIRHLLFPTMLLPMIQDRTWTCLWPGPETHPLHKDSGCVKQQSEIRVRETTG